MELTNWLEERGALEINPNDEPPRLPPGFGPSSNAQNTQPIEQQDVHQLDWERLMSEPEDGDHQWWELDEFLDEELHRELEEISCGDALPPPIETANPRGEDGRAAHWDICAWYQPIHFYGASAGIFIYEDCVKRYLKRLAIQYRHITQAPIQRQDLPRHERTLTRAAIFIFFLHEQFHHSVESLGFRLHAVRQTSSYLPYKARVYRPLFGTDDCLEEALANANMWHRIGDQTYRKLLNKTYLITKHSQPNRGA